MDIKVSPQFFTLSRPGRHIWWPGMIILGLGLTIAWMCVLGYGLFTIVQYLISSIVA